VFCFAANKPKAGLRWLQASSVFLFPVTSFLRRGLLLPSAIAIKNGFYRETPVFRSGQVFINFHTNILFGIELNQ
jgi:hypothetical protein